MEAARQAEQEIATKKIEAVEAKLATVSTQLKSLESTHTQASMCLPRTCTRRAFTHIPAALRPRPCSG